MMTWAAVAVGTVSAVGAGVSAAQANKRAKSVGNSLNDTIAFARKNPGVFGEKMDWESVGYSPFYQTDPGYGNAAGDVIAGNQRNLPANLALTSQTNQAITADSVNRINTLYPGFGAAFDQQAGNTLNFLRGDIPGEDRDMMSSRRSEAISLGGGGNTGQQVAADLGLMRLDLMKQGAADLTNNVNLLNMFDPISRHATPQSNFVDVGQALSSMVQENQFAAQFAQSERDSEFNYAMMPDPQKAGLMNLLAQRAGLQAANPQQSVLGNAALSGLTAGATTYFSSQAAAAAQQRAAQSAMVPQGYVAPKQMGYATVGDRSAGINTISGGGPASVAAPAAPAYNPNTGAGFGEQGGLWSFYNSKPATR